ncbi:hypothetical protein [Pseudomonas sp. RIT-PI-S]|uniref:hypothetical protein n=1 Tax=Pseudomonas sp. RIT-PI-S TaxID=3035295 RepID=UPI0021D7F3E0|nr:hypothetical protein [Pseudomonas sp. RIT-PI-S]
MSIPARSINNPLALIAVLAATTEASALASLPLLDYRNQGVFVWFLVGFPPFLTALFFITLNFNRQALTAAPMDTCHEELEAWMPSAQTEVALEPSPVGLSAGLTTTPSPLLSHKAISTAARLHIFEYSSQGQWQQLHPLVQAWADNALAELQGKEPGVLMLLVQPRA